jgi:hypothetical protein
MTRAVHGSTGLDSGSVYRRDRLANIALLGVGLAAWVAVYSLFTTYSPVGDSGVAMAGAVLLGFAVGVTSAPIYWVAAFLARRGIAHRGDWTRAGRRAVLTGLVVTLLVVLRALDAFSLPLAVFVIVMAGLVELSLTGRR